MRRARDLQPPVQAMRVSARAMREGVLVNPPTHVSVPAPLAMIKGTGSPVCPSMDACPEHVLCTSLRTLRQLVCHALCFPLTTPSSATMHLASICHSILVAPFAPPLSSLDSKLHCVLPMCPSGAPQVPLAGVRPYVPGNVPAVGLCPPLLGVPQRVQREGALRVRDVPLRQGLLWD